MLRSIKKLLSSFLFVALALCAVPTPSCQAMAVGTSGGEQTRKQKEEDAPKWYTVALGLFVVCGCTWVGWKVAPKLWKWLYNSKKSIFKPSLAQDVRVGSSVCKGECQEVDGTRVTKVKVVPQGGSNGSRSCGYHAVMNVCKIIRSLFEGKEDLKEHLEDSKLVNQLFQTAGWFRWPGTWRKIIIDGRSLFWQACPSKNLGYVEVGDLDGDNLNVDEIDKLINAEKGRLFTETILVRDPQTGEVIRNENQYSAEFKGRILGNNESLQAIPIEIISFKGTWSDQSLARLQQCRTNLNNSNNYMHGFILDVGDHWIGDVVYKRNGEVNHIITNSMNGSLIVDSTIQRVVDVINGKDN